MAETGGDITGNDDAISLRDFIQGHSDHVDVGVHEVLERLGRIERHLEAIVTDLDSYRPLLDKWKNSKLAGLAAGRMPWQQG